MKANREDVLLILTVQEMSGAIVDYVFPGEEMRARTMKIVLSMKGVNLEDV